MYRLTVKSGKGIMAMKDSLRFHMYNKDLIEKEIPKDNKSGLEMNYKELKHAFFGKKRN